MRHHALPNDLVLDLVDTNSAPVVADLDEDVIPPLGCLKGNRPRGGLASDSPLLGRLDPMVDAVADQVEQRFPQGVDHLFVEFCLFSRDIELDLLAVLHAQVSDHPFETIEERCNGYHSRLENASLQVLGNSPQLIDGILDLIETLVSFVPILALLLQRLEILIDSIEEMTDVGIGFGSIRIRIAEFLNARAKPIHKVATMKRRGAAGYKRLQRIGYLRESGVGDDEFPCQIHQLIQSLGLHANGLIAGFLDPSIDAGRRIDSAVARGGCHRS